MTDPVPSKDLSAVLTELDKACYSARAERYGSVRIGLSDALLILAALRTAPEPCPKQRPSGSDLDSPATERDWWRAYAMRLERAAQPPPAAHSVWCNAPFVPGAACTCKKVDGQPPGVCTDCLAAPGTDGVVQHREGCSATYLNSEIVR